MYCRSLVMLAGLIFLVTACGAPEAVAPSTPGSVASEPGEPVKRAASTIDLSHPTATPTRETPTPSADGDSDDRRGLTQGELARALAQILTDPIQASEDPAAPAISRGLATIGMSDDIDLAPYVVDMMGVTPFGIFYREHAGDVLNRLTGERYAGDWFVWVQWIADHPELEPGPAYPRWKRTLLASLDPRFAAFLPDDALHTIRIEEVVWSGVPAIDGIPSLDDPPFIAIADADYLDSDEHVFGVSINGDSRAYPLRIMN